MVQDEAYVTELTGRTRVNLLSPKSALAIAFGLAWAACTFAQTYPVKPIRLIVTSPAGSVSDIRARWISERLTAALGKSIVVDNRGGAGGNIGAEAAAKSPKDGYTLLIIHQGTAALNPHMYSRPGYNPITDFAPITRFVVSPLLLAVHPGTPAKTVAELIDMVRKKPGQFDYGSPGSGTPPHMAAELFKRMAKIDATHVPYKGGAAAVLDLMGGRLTYTFDALALQVECRGGEDIENARGARLVCRAGRGARGRHAGRVCRVHQARARALGTHSSRSRDQGGLISSLNAKGRSS